MVPGRLTTAYLVLRIALGNDSAYASCRSSEILEEVALRVAPPPGC